ncbi:MAG: Low affinity NH4+ transporter [Piccolia ochrophora]|nr:MAG: Low affinity NH4+ transporter [Piccolia ochrophora]
MADAMESSENHEEQKTALQSKNDTPKRPPFSALHEVFFVATIASAQILTQAGLGQAIAPLHIVGAHYGITNPGQLSWQVAAYSLTVGTFILVAGRLGDINGHKNMFILGYVWTALWALLAGASYYSTDIFFNVCRGFQGIGPAFLLPNALAILGRTYPEGKRKNIIFSLFGACAPGGFVLGAAFSGLFAQLAWWAWAYWVMAIVCALMAAISYWIIPKDDIDEDDKGTTKAERFDFAGAVTGVAGLVFVNVAWNEGPRVGWGTPYVYVLLIVGLLTLVAFGYLEARMATRPLVSIKAFSGTTGFVLACIAAGWSSFGIWIFYIWQFLQELRGVSPLLGAAQVVPAAVSGFIAALTTGYLMTHMPTPYIMVLAMLAFCVGTVIVATMPVEQTYWAQSFVSFVVIPWGMDMSFPAATLILSASVPREHQGVAASLVNTVVNYSISIGLGIAGTVASRVDPDGRALLDGYRSAWYTGIGLSGVGVMIALCGAWFQRRR